MSKDNSRSLLYAHGGYRNLLSFKLSQLVYDVTVRFCNRYIERRSRTHDQMAQAARSWVQNIPIDASEELRKKTVLRET
jgi:hypothetical protein